MDTDSTIRGKIEGLQYYYEKIAHDGVIGLEAKLCHSGRASKYAVAARQKEYFVMMLAKFSLYAAAQEIFAYILSKIDNTFNVYVHPRVDAISIAECDQIVLEKIVEPTIQEVGVGAFTMNANMVMGMLYWLAEQCYIRWHS